MDEDETHDGKDPPPSADGEPPEDEDRTPPGDDGREPPEDEGQAPPDDEGRDPPEDDEGDEQDFEGLESIPPEELRAHFELFYRELHDIAARLMRGLGAAHTLQPTALIHEAFLKLFGWSARRWNDSSHFLAIAARAMRHVLLDHARRKKAGKRLLLGERLPLDQLLGATPFHGFDDLQALHVSLEKLHDVRPRCAEIVDMLYFLFLPRQEAYELCKESLGISQRTLERDYAFAKAWLRARIE